MHDFFNLFKDFSPISLAFIATLFTWACTAFGVLIGFTLMMVFDLGASDLLK